MNPVTDDLAEVVERATIHALEAAGIILRNVAFASRPHVPSDFNLTMPVDNQERWLAEVG